MFLHQWFEKGWINIIDLGGIGIDHWGSVINMLDTVFTEQFHEEPESEHRLQTFTIANGKMANQTAGW